MRRGGGGTRTTRTSRQALTRRRTRGATTTIGERKRKQQVEMTFHLILFQGGTCVTRDVPPAPEIPPRADDAHRGRTSRRSADQRERTPSRFLLSRVSVLSTECCGGARAFPVVRDRCLLFFFFSSISSPFDKFLYFCIRSSLAKTREFILDTRHTSPRTTTKVEKGRKPRVPNTTTPPHTFSSPLYLSPPVRRGSRFAHTQLCFAHPPSRTTLRPDDKKMRYSALLKAAMSSAVSTTAATMKTAASTTAVPLCSRVSYAAFRIPVDISFASSPSSTFSSSFSRQIWTTPPCMGRKAAKVAGKKVGGRCSIQSRPKKNKKHMHILLIFFSMGRGKAGGVGGTLRDAAVSASPPPWGGEVHVFVSFVAHIQRALQCLYTKPSAAEQGGRQAPEDLR